MALPVPLRPFRRWDPLEKPRLGIIAEDGLDTNIVLGRENCGLVHCAYVLLDELEESESRRFKMLFEHRRIGQGDDMTGAGCFRVASSADGIRWDLWEDPVRYGQCGSVAGDVVTVSIDKHSGIYIANNRHPYMCSAVLRDKSRPADPGWMPPSYPGNPVLQNRRRIFRSESPDLIHWSTPTPLLVPDPDLDNIDDELYGMEQFRIGDHWVGVLNVLHGADNTMDVQLAYSRNGRDFKRVRASWPWIARGPVGSWDQCLITVCSKPIVVDDELYVYYGGAKNHHDWWIVGPAEGLTVPESGNLDKVEYALGLAKMKVDRFVSIAASDGREGILVTRPMRPRGGQLVINSLCNEGGYIQASIADGKGKVLEGFERENCITFTADAVAVRLRWKGMQSIPHREWMKLHFFLKSAELFSFQFVS